MSQKKISSGVVHEVPTDLKTSGYAVIQAGSVNTRHLNSVDRDDADVSCHYAVLPAGNRTGRHRLPSRSAFFPLVVGELLDVGAVVTHHENLPVRLRRIRVRHLVFKAHRGTREGDQFAIE
jgi:hypothetical protein